jgi:hypothetical protein
MLTEDDKSFIPYLPGQQIRFKHNSGNIVKVSVIDMFTGESRTVTDHCNDDYTTYEFMVAELFGSNPSLYLRLMVLPLDVSPYLTLTVNNNHFLLDRTIPYTYDSIYIDSLLYRDVYQLESHISDTTIIQPKEVLYNKDYGILEIKLTNNEVFDLYQ